MSKTDNNTLANMIDADTMKHIKELFSNIVPGDEFEIMLFNFNKVHLSLEKYISLLKYMNKRAKGQKLHSVESYALDVNYTDDNSTNYRVTVDNINNINKTIEQLHKYKNHVVISTLLTKMASGDKSITAMKKIKDKENVADFADLNMRVRAATEADLTKAELETLKTLSHEVAYKILYRLKQRVSFFIVGNEDTGNYIKIDITLVKSHKNINKLNDTVANYELEIEFGHKDAKFKNTSHLDIMFKEVEYLLKTIQQSNFMITNSTEKLIVNEYARIVGLDGDKIISLDGRKPVSLEIQHVTDMLPNRYAVTDKADGDRYFLIIVQNHVYLISSNLHVKDTGIVLDKSLSKYNDTIIDGEYIFLPSKNRHLYMAFDCLFNSGKDLRKNPDMMDRIKNADEVVANCFIFDKQKGFVINDYNSKDKEFDLDKVAAFHEKQIKDFISALNADIDINKKYPLIRRKYFIPVLGAKPWEIFKYSVILWNKYTTDPSVKCPYMLDGMIYQPLIQEYVTNMKDSKLTDYKWKPPTKNSIDFYIEFVKDKTTNKILTVYDNSNDEYERNKAYKICQLHVGKRGKYGEEASLFRENENGYTCHIFMDGENAVDIEGNLIADNTVVEFYYNNNAEVDEKFRWIPIRTRYDKTESVLRYGKGFGNYIDVANKVWRSMINPVLITDFEDLAKGNDDVAKIFYYDKKLSVMRSKVSHELIVSSAKENVYFQVKTNLVQPMTQFHNWLKSIFIYTHCHPMYTNDKSLTVLDLACGRGSDIMRFYYTKVALMVGLDIDYESLISSVNGALSRYSKMRKSNPRFPKMFFIHGDASALLNYDDQFRALKGMTNDNKTNMEKFFHSDPAKRTMFDRINMQFAIHYMFKNTETWTNFKQNLNDYLKPGGYFLISTYDGGRIVELLKDNDTFTQYYTTVKGEKKKLFEIIKKYPNIKSSDAIGVGNAIDFFAAWLFLEGNYQTEYLVDRKFIESDLLTDCDMELVDTDTFDNTMEMHRDFFAKYAQFESVEETRKFMDGAGKYYNSRDDINASCYSNTRLYRYYVFKKKDNAKPKILSIQKGGSSIDILDGNQFKVHDTKDSKTSCCTSIYSILKAHKLIPSTLSPSEFFTDFGIEVKSDNDVDVDYLSDINNKITIYHENDSGKSKKILDGLNIFIGERDCNNHIDYSLISTKNVKHSKAVILLKDGSYYKPIYKIEGAKKRGIFNIDDPLISKLMEYVD